MSGEVQLFSINGYGESMKTKGTGGLSQGALIYGFTRVKLILDPPLPNETSLEVSSYMKSGHILGLQIMSSWV